MATKNKNIGSHWEPFFLLQILIKLVENSITKNEFGKKSSSRNPLIFGLFERMRLVEQIGSVIARKRDVMKEEGLIPAEFNIDRMFTVTLRRPFDFEKWVEKLTDNRVKILREVHNNPKVTKIKSEQAVSISASAIDNNIDILKNFRTTY